MTREEKIEALVRNELEWLVDNYQDGDNLPNAIKFFAEGGFHKYSDNLLNRAYQHLLEG